MVVSITFHGRQRAVTRTRAIDMPIDEGSQVTDALDYVKRRFPELPLDHDRFLATVNSEVVPSDRALRARDTVSFLPSIKDSDCGKRFAI